MVRSRPADGLFASLTDCLKPSVCAVELIKFCFLAVSLGLEVEDLVTGFGCDKIGK